jgi:Kef-type K+ transport system membrane component KefB
MTLLLPSVAPGEFAFVALGIAERSGLIDRALCKLLLTTVALSMAATPMLAELGGYISNRIEQEKGKFYQS